MWSNTVEEQRGEDEPGTYRERTRNVPGTYQDCIMLPGGPFCVCFSAQIEVLSFLLVHTVEVHHCGGAVWSNTDMGVC